MAVTTTSITALPTNDKASVGARPKRTLAGRCDASALSIRPATTPRPASHSASRRKSRTMSQASVGRCSARHARFDRSSPSPRHSCSPPRTRSALPNGRASRCRLWRRAVCRQADPDTKFIIDTDWKIGTPPVMVRREPPRRSVGIVSAVCRESARALAGRLLRNGRGRRRRWCAHLACTELGHRVVHLESRARPHVDVLRDCPIPWQKQRDRVTTRRRGDSAGRSGKVREQG